MGPGPWLERGRRVSSVWDCLSKDSEKQTSARLSVKQPFQGVSRGRPASRLATRLTCICFGVDAFLT